MKIVLFLISTLTIALSAQATSKKYFRKPASTGQWACYGALVSKDKSIIGLLRPDGEPNQLVSFLEFPGVGAYYFAAEMLGDNVKLQIFPEAGKEGLLKEGPLTSANHSLKISKNVKAYISCNKE